MRKIFDDQWKQRAGKSFFEQDMFKLLGGKETAQLRKFTASCEAAQARVEATLELGVQACLDEACGLGERDGPPIPREQIREVFLKYCMDAFDRAVPLEAEGGAK
jgi:hypothetical protein